MNLTHSLTVNSLLVHSGDFSALGAVQCVGKSPTPVELKQTFFAVGVKALECAGSVKDTVTQWADNLLLQFSGAIHRAIHISD